MNEENEIIKIRKEKLDWLIKQKIEPYPYSFDKKNDSLAISKKFAKIKAGAKTKIKVSVAGRIMTSRIMGKASFLTIQDQTGKIQIFATRDTLKNYDIIKKLDNGDIIGIKGFIFKTKAGELTVHAEEFKLLSKSLSPIPSKWHGLKDEEIRYRQRYLDLIANPEIKEIFIKRDKILQETRNYLNKLDFIEVEIPTLQTIYGGAKARPFKTHINAWDINLFLSISPELHLKRLLVGGFEKVYTIGKNFRNEGVDKTHNPEFTMMELYWAYKDYADIMKLTENIISTLAKKVTGSTKVKYQGEEIDFKTPWTRITMKDSLKKFAKLNVENLSDQEIKKLLKEHEIELPEYNRGWAINYLFEELVENKLVQPTFVTDYPRETTPLCKVKRNNPELIERFELFINGWEIANAYSELNNPLIQKKLLEEQERERKSGNQEANPMDEDFIKAIEIGMPPAGGLGIGMDRVVMLLTNANSLREVIAFPTMRPKKE